ncbi:MAG: SDR family oxidoreductase [Alphaproteobacteria bacterium]|nr:SDR family oxidoreductase [Alphaproteobacteria bacterium]
MSARSHEGRVAIVTGGGRGIGQGIARLLAARGARVGVLDVEPVLAMETASAIGPGAVGIACDVSDPASVDEAFATVERAFGRIEILVNNAGISPKHQGRRADIQDMDPAEWRRVMAVNLDGAFNCVRRAVPAMIAARRGVIVNQSSVAGKTFYGDFPLTGVHYAASKAGLIGFTKHLAGELGPHGITVNAIAPGRIDTPLMRGVASEVNESIRRDTPLGRLGTPEDVARAVCFLTGADAAFVTGQTIDVAGGWLIT